MSSVRALLVIGTLAIASAGCSRPVYTPEVAGVVASRQELADGSFQIVLENGRSQNVETHRQRIIVGGGVPDLGELPLAGSSPTPWVARLAPRFDCFWIGGSGSEEGGYVTTDGGLRLPESADFERGPYGADEHEFHGGGFCVNGSGEVTAVK